MGVAGEEKEVEEGEEGEGQKEKRGKDAQQLYLFISNVVHASPHHWYVNLLHLNQQARVATHPSSHIVSDVYTLQVLRRLCLSAFFWSNSVSCKQHARCNHTVKATTVCNLVRCTMCTCMYIYTFYKESPSKRAINYIKSRFTKTCVFVLPPFLAFHSLHRCFVK